MAVVVAVDTAVLVAVTTIVVVPPPFPALSLCCAPANKPMKTELRRRKMMVATSRI